MLVVSQIDRLSRDGFRIMAMLEDAGVKYIEASSPNEGYQVFNKQR